MEKDLKSRRVGAGLNRHLSADFISENFRGTDSGKAETENVGVPKRLVSSEKAPSISMKETASSNRTHISLQKKLAILAEKKDKN
ncbi:hypothetical protein JTB14_017328 [Gonioctena quinquepunctata]|nr:hypothetical protein JTB14_017328 [Gonioctena quinquepunctata]